MLRFKTLITHFHHFCHCFTPTKHAALFVT